MKFQYLGTAAAEGIPALFCACENCRRSREIGGRALRTRSQAIIDGRLLLDFPADTYSHILREGIDMMDVRYCFVTHRHSDHLYPTDIHYLAPAYAHLPEGYKITFYGSEKIGEAVKAQIAGVITDRGNCEFVELKAFDRVKVEKYTVTALPAIHDPKAGPLFYMISDGEKTVLYAHDTNYFCDEVWDYFAENKPRLDLVSLDCTNVCTPMTYVGHMSFEENRKIRDRLISLGCADGGTRFICNHFSHNGANAVYDDFVKIAAKEDFSVSYDGMTVIV